MENRRHIEVHSNVSLFYFKTIFFYVRGCKCPWQVVTVACGRADHNSTR